MKKQYKIFTASFFALACLIGTSCSKKLIEQPYTVFTTDYFKTPDGFQNAVNALYSGMRWNFGPEGGIAVTLAGTDEWTYSQQTATGAGGTPDFLSLSNYTVSSANGAILTPWNRNYNSINLANAVVKYAADVAIDPTIKNRLVAEARFLRGLYYLLLVQQFGAVPVDLGSGDLQFNQTAFQGFNRLPIDTVLTKDYAAMVSDFTFASQNLPDQRPTNAFRLSKAAAFLMLARVYTFRAYSSKAQTTDFQSASAAAMEVINNQSKYGTALLQDFSQVHASGNDYNQEILYSVERIPGDNSDNEFYDQTGSNDGIGATKGNDAGNEFNPDYINIHAPTKTSGVLPCATRTVLYGRPIARIAPTTWLFNTAFADKDNDSRYNGSFRTVWLATTAAGTFAVGDTAIVIANTNAMADSMNAIPKKYRVIAPREFYTNQNPGASDARFFYPGLKKYEDPLKTDPNAQTGRPFVVAKLSELYLLAAEAAFQTGNLSGAATLLNTLRERAAYRNGLSAAVLTARKANMDITSSQITLDFILDERTRELCGESVRWPDLAMRGKLVSRVQANNPDGAPNVKPFHMLRPIPQSQLDNTADANKAQYQNPGY